MKKFRIISKNTKDHWLEIEGWEEGCGILKKDGTLEPIMDTHIVCKWDGCTDYRTYANGYSWDHKCDDNCQCCEYYIHICDIDDFIDELKKTKEIAVNFFKGKQGEEYWQSKS